jgi:hypothetical protein
VFKRDLATSLAVEASTIVISGIRLLVSSNEMTGRRAQGASRQTIQFDVELLGDDAQSTLVELVEQLVDPTSSLRNPVSLMHPHHRSSRSCVPWV